MDAHVANNSWTKNYQVISSGSELIQSPCCACSKCNTCMAGKEVFTQNNKPYCWECFEISFGLGCVSCLKPITGLYQMTFIYYNNQVWHKDCFHCSNCGISLQRREVVQRGRFAYCKQCFFEIGNSFCV